MILKSSPFRFHCKLKLASRIELEKLLYGTTVIRAMFDTSGPLQQNGTCCDLVFLQRMWSCYERTLNGQQRTNNYTKAAHKRLQTAELQMDHPSIWRLIEGLKHIQKGRGVFYERVVAGHAPPAKRRKYRQADERLLNLVRNYSNQPMVEYLHSVAHNFEMND